jgi:hypothetical protein
MSTKTINLGLNQADHDDVVDYDLHLNQNWNVLDSGIGNPTNLLTINKNLVAAINEIFGVTIGILPPPTVREFTATANQTVFTIPQYDVGLNELEVEVDGVPQHMNRGYTETNSTTITLAEGLPAGAHVLVRKI